VNTFVTDYKYAKMASLGYGYYATHPGEILKDELDARGISQRKFAEGIGMSYSVLNEILNGRRTLSTSSALMFEAALGVYAESLMNLQMKYSMQMAREDKTLADKLKKIAQIAAVL
jgi:addiction module HigA family antidote